MDRTISPLHLGEGSGERLHKIMNTLKIFFRNLKHRKAVTLINIAGLVLGITGAVLIFEYVFYERSYDAHYKDADDVYRLVYHRYRGETLLWKTVGTFYPSGEYLKSNFAEVEDYFHMDWRDNIEIAVKEEENTMKSIFEKRAYFASETIFDHFDLPMTRGTADCLTEPNTAAISERMAKKLFNDQDPIGKTIVVNSRERYAITGVYENFPSNSHIKSDILFSDATRLVMTPSLRTSWGNDHNFTYLRLKPGTDYKAFEKKAFPKMVDDNYAEQLNNRGERDDYYIQPIKSIHLNSALESEPELPGNKKGVDVLFGFAVFLLVIAWINYVNLITARSVDRAKEVGVKKVCGAGRSTLIRQFISEAVFFNLICVALSVALVIVLMPFFKQLTGIEHLGLIVGTKFLSYAGLFILSGIALSSIYPAFVLSSFRPFDVLKGKFKSSGQGIALRKGLITFQLFVSISLFIGTGIIYTQVDYLTRKDPGYSYQSVLVVRAPRTTETGEAYRSKIELLADRLRQKPNVRDFTFVSDIPGQEILSWYSLYVKGDDPSSVIGFFRTDVDLAFFDFFKMRMLAGRTFNEEDRVSQNKHILNEKGMQRLGFQSPEETVGAIVMRGKQEMEIIGVVEDANYRSVKVEAVPTAFTLRNDAKQYMAVKYTGTADLKSIISDLESEYRSIFPDNAFDYEVLEDKIAADTRTDHVFSLVFGIFSVLAGVISVIGIMGLVIIIINQNMKELGIRRVLGARLPAVNSFLWKHFYPQLIVAVCLAIPVSYYVFQKQVLEGYIYRISISPNQLILPVIFIALVLAIVIVILARKAFSENLTRILKSE